jgi:hypothetical protein
MNRRSILSRPLLVLAGGISLATWSLSALASGGTSATATSAGTGRVAEATAVASSSASPAKSASLAPAAAQAPATGTALVGTRAGDPGPALYSGNLEAGTGARTIRVPLPNSANDCQAIHAAHPELQAPPTNCVTVVTLNMSAVRTGSSGTASNQTRSAGVPTDPVPLPDLGGTTSVSGGPCVLSANGGCVVSDPIDPTNGPSTIVPIPMPNTAWTPADTNTSNPAARPPAVAAGGVYYANAMAGTNINLRDNGQPNYYREIQGSICSGAPGNCNYWVVHFDTAWHYDYMTVWQDWLTCSADYWSPWQTTISWCGTWNNGGPHKGDPYNYMSSGTNFDVHCCGYNYSHWFRMDENIYGDASYRGG